MMWLVVLIVVVRLIMVLRNMSLKKTNVNILDDGNNQIHSAPILDTADTEEDDLIAAITAAIHEFTGTGDFEVVSIKPSGDNWTLTGRLNLLRNRV
jgi:hypothetical protein